MIGLIVISFLVYSGYHFKHKSYSNKIKKCKEKYNELQNFNQYINFSTLISYKNSHAEGTDSHIEVILDVLSNKKKDLNRILAVTRENILKLTDAASQYNFKLQKKIYKPVEDDLMIADKIHANINELYTKTQKYFDEADDFYLNIVELYNQIKSFYLKNLSNKYHNETYKSTMDIIENDLVSINKSKNSELEHHKLNEAIEEIKARVKIFLSLISDTYRYDRIISYLENKRNAINSSNYKNDGLNDDEITFIRQQLIIGTNSIKKMKELIQVLQFKQLEGFAKIGASALEKTLNKIELEKKINEVLNEDIHLLTTQINYLISVTDKLFIAFTDIEEKIGKKNTEINKLILQSKYEIVNILDMHINLDASIKNNDIPKNEIGEKLSLIIMNILNWINELHTTITLINNTYKQFIKINDMLFENKNVVGQLINLKIKYAKHDIGSVSALNTYYERLKEVEEKLYLDYEKNNAECFKELNKIQTDLKNIITEISGDIILYKYAERLLMFLNKYRHEHNDIKAKLNEVFLKFNSQEFNSSESLNELITLAENIKYSGKKYGIEIK